MSYHREEPYIWSDGEWLHIRTVNHGNASIPMEVFDFIALRRSAELKGKDQQYQGAEYEEAE